MDECMDVDTLNSCRREVQKCGEANVHIIPGTCPIRFDCNAFFQTYAASLDSHEQNNFISSMKAVFQESIEQHLPTSIRKMLITSYRFFKTSINMGFFAFDRGKNDDKRKEMRKKLF